MKQGIKIADKDTSGPAEEWSFGKVDVQELLSHKCMTIEAFAELEQNYHSMGYYLSSMLVSKLGRRCFDLILKRKVRQDRVLPCRRTFSGNLHHEWRCQVVRPRIASVHAEHDGGIAQHSSRDIRCGRDSVRCRSPAVMSGSVRCQSRSDKQIDL